MIPHDPYSDGSPALTPERVLETWRRRKWTAVAIGTITLTGTVVAAASLPNLYRASAIVVVEREVSEEFVRPSVTSALETRVHTIHQLVTSRERLAGLIDELGLYPELRQTAPIEDVIAKMRRDIAPPQLRGVERTVGGAVTIAFTLGYTGRDPETVARVVNTLVGIYVNENATSRGLQAAGTAEFLRRQLDDAKRDLDATERQNRTFALTYTDELPQQLEVNLAALGRIQSQLSSNSERQLRLLERRERLEQDITLGSLVAPPVDALSPAARLVGLQQQLDRMRRTFSPEYPDVRRLVAEVAALEAEIARSAGGPTTNAMADPSARRDQSLRELETELTGLQQQEVTLRREIGRYEVLVGRTPRRQLEMDQLSQGHGLAKQRYETLLGQYEAAQLAATLEEGQGVERFRVLDAALPPSRPIAPDRQLLALLGVLASLALAVVAVVAREKLDATIHTPDDLRGLAAVPVVAVRRLDTPAARRRVRLRAALAVVVVLLAIGLAAASAYYVASGNERIVVLTSRESA